VSILTPARRKVAIEFLRFLGAHLLYALLVLAILAALWGGLGVALVLLLAAGVGRFAFWGLASGARRPRRR
jgi:hypothetical protein